MEIKASIIQKGEINYNKEEIEAGLLLLESKYNGLVFREEDLKEAKEERAKLNKVVKAIDNHRKQVVGEALEPVKNFEDFMKESSNRAKILSENIGYQITKFEAVKKLERIEVVKNHLKEIYLEEPKLKEFLDQIDLEEKIFSNLGSFKKDGTVGTKIIDYIDVKLQQANEVLEARRIQEEALEEKRKLIVSTCNNLTDSLQLRVSLSPTLFRHLKNSTLSEIIDDITIEAKKQKEKEIEAVEKIRREEAEKVRMEQEIKNREIEKAIEEPVKEVVAEPKQTIEKTEEKLYDFDLEITEINVEKAKRLKQFLIDNKINYELKGRK